MNDPEFLQNWHAQRRLYLRGQAVRRWIQLHSKRADLVLLRIIRLWLLPWLEANGFVQYHLSGWEPSHAFLHNHHCRGSLVKHESEVLWGCLHCGELSNKFMGFSSIKNYATAAAS